MKMINDFDRILDECIDRLNRGEGLEACLADYPEHVERLGPLLQAMLQTTEAYSFKPSAGAKREARQRFNAALERRRQQDLEKQPLFAGLFGRLPVWAAVTAAVVVILAGYFGLRFLAYPAAPVPSQVAPVPGPIAPVPSQVALVPNSEGNFVFLISDEVNAIADFESLTVSISKVGLLSGGDSGQWVEFEPEIAEVDLTLVQGDKTQEIWRGDVPEGQYTAVFIYVADVSGVLKETGQTVDVKLPSQKLHMSKAFLVTADTVTSFTYDVTVIAAGNAQSGIRYILQPLVGQSGADHRPSETKGKGGKPDTPGPNVPIKKPD